MNFVGDDIDEIVQMMRDDLTADSGIISADAVGLAPYYMYGHRLEITNRTTLKDSDATEKNEKFPLVALRQDIIEQRNGNVVSYNLNLVIATDTSFGLNSQERQAQVIEPVLEPLYDLFLTMLKRSGFFMWDGKKNQVSPPHTKIVRPFYGTVQTEGNVANLFNDPTDAIELIDFKVNKIIKPC